MEQLLSLGTQISQIVKPTYGIYAPLLQAQAEEIKTTSCKTYSYGSHPRHNLDIYAPSTNIDSVTKNSNSVLIFLYGGGLLVGDKCNKTYLDGLVYANLGHYFAAKLGFEVIIMDYRLVSHGAKFPSGGEDLALALDWIVKRSSSPPDMYLMGNSAGGIHLSTYLLAPRFHQHRSKMMPNLKAAVFVSVPFHFERADESRNDILRTYYGDDETGCCPLGLLRSAKQDETIGDLCSLSVLVLKGDLDPEDEILVPIADFVAEWRSAASVSSNLVLQSMKGHNHISPVLSLGTSLPDEETWGRQTIDFIVSSSRK